MYVLMYVEREREIRKELEAVLVAEAALVVEKFSRGRQRGLAYKLHSSLIASFSGSCT